MRETERLAEAISDLRYHNLPSDVVETAKVCLLDLFGVTLAGAHEPLVDILDIVLSGFGGEPQATLVGRGRKVSLLHAALVNGAAAHALDFDDMHLAMAGHPSAPVAPAALAVAEFQRRSGRDLLLAFAVGLEVECRLGEAVNPSHYDRGWHATGTLGHFGAAAAVASLLGLSPIQTSHALGLAGTQASGLKEVFGTMTKPFHAGRASADRLLAALLAAQEFTSAPNILEGERGFGRVLADKVDWDNLLSGWGDRFSLREILFKQYASAFCTQALVDGILTLRVRHGLSADAVVGIRVAVSRLSVENAPVGEPITGLEGKFSLTHAAAQALAEGHADEADFVDGKMANPLLASLRRRVQITTDANLGWPEATVEIQTTDGRCLVERVDLQAKAVDLAAKRSAVQAKFRNLTGSLLAPEHQSGILDFVDRLDGTDDLGPLFSLLERL